MVVTLGQQYNIGEKPTVILYTFINHHAGTQKKTKKRKQNSTSNMVVIIYCHIGCEAEVTRPVQRLGAGRGVAILSPFWEVTARK